MLNTHSLYFGFAIKSYTQITSISFRKSCISILSQSRLNAQIHLPLWPSRVWVTEMLLGAASPFIFASSKKNNKIHYEKKSNKAYLLPCSYEYSTCNHNLHRWTKPLKKKYIVTAGWNFHPSVPFVCHSHLSSKLIHALQSSSFSGKKATK